MQVFCTVKAHLASGTWMAAHACEGLFFLFLAAAGFLTGFDHSSQASARQWEPSHMTGAAMHHKLLAHCHASGPGDQW